MISTGAVGQSPAEVVLLNEKTGVADGTVTLPVGRKDVEAFNEGVGVADGTLKFPGNEVVTVIT